MGLGRVLALLLLPAAAGSAIQLQPEENLSASDAPSNLNEVGPQALAIDGQGRVVVVWSEFTGEEQSPPELAMRVGPPGAGWGPVVPLTANDRKYSGDAALAADAGGVHVAWVDQATGTFEVWVARIDLEAGKLVDPKAISSGAQLVMEPAIAAGPEAELVVEWTAMQDMNYELRLRRWSAKGGWGPVAEVTPADHRASDQIALAYGPDGRLHLVWADNRAGARRILQAIAGPAGIGQPVEVSPFAGPGKQTRPAIAIDGKGQVAIAWQDGRTGTDEVLVARSTETGGFSGQPLRAGKAKELSRSPCLISGREGELYLLWEDGRRGTMVETASVEIYCARVAGEALADERAVTTDRPVSCFNPCGAVDAAGNLHLVWRNTGIGEGDIFYRTGR